MTVQTIFLLSLLVSCVSAQFIGADLSSDSSNPLDELSDTQFIVVLVVLLVAMAILVFVCCWCECGRRCLLRYVFGRPYYFCFCICTDCCKCCMHCKKSDAEMQAIAEHDKHRRKTKAAASPEGAKDAGTPRLVLNGTWWNPFRKRSSYAPAARHPQPGYPVGGTDSPSHVVDLEGGLPKRLRISIIRPAGAGKSKPKETFEARDVKLTAEALEYKRGQESFVAQLALSEVSAVAVMNHPQAWTLYVNDGTTYEFFTHSSEARQAWIAAICKRLQEHDEMMAAEEGKAPGPAEPAASAADKPMSIDQRLDEQKAGR